MFLWRLFLCDWDLLTVTQKEMELGCGPESQPSVSRGHIQKRI